MFRQVGHWLYHREVMLDRDEVQYRLLGGAVRVVWSGMSLATRRRQPDCIYILGWVVWSAEGVKRTGRWFYCRTYLAWCDRMKICLLGGLVSVYWGGEASIVQGRARPVRVYLRDRLVLYSEMIHRRKLRRWRSSTARHLPPKGW